MCGLVGIFDAKSERSIDPMLLRSMNDALHHRGPDGDGFHLEPGLGLGHRRLSIIDITGGDQPMSNPSGSIVVVFNGEIYNFQDLRAELEGLGYQFRTRCDTEVIIHGWDAWGPACVDRLHGMFAVALWHKSEETLYLFRDRLGKNRFIMQTYPMAILYSGQS